MRPRVYTDESLRDLSLVYADRLEGGLALARLLGEALGDLGVEPSDALMLAVPAGGVPVALMVASRLGLRFDLVVARKIPLPWNPEAGIGAMAPDGEWFVEDWALEMIGEDVVARLVEHVREVLKAREERFREGRPYPDMEGRVVVVVDDGIAAGYTMRAAGGFARRRGARTIIAAAPTACERSIGRLTMYDAVVAPNIRGGPFFAVADAYKLWYDLGDDEVLELLEEAKRRGLYPP